MSKKRRQIQEQRNPSPHSQAIVQAAAPDPNLVPLRQPIALSLVALAGLTVWLMSLSNWFLYTFFTTHVQDNFRVLFAFGDLLSTVRFDALASHARDVVWALAIFSSAFSLGRVVLDLFKFDLGDWGRQLKALAVGLGTCSLGLLLLGLLGLWTKPILMTLVVIPLIIGLARHPPEFVAWIRTRNVGAWNKEATIWEMLGFALLAAYLVMNFMGALGPEYFYDSLVYHLAMPKLYLLNHRIVPTPHMIYSGIPFGTEMLYGLGLAFGTETAAKLIHYGFGVATAATIYSWCRKHANRRAAILAVLLFYSAPMVCFGSVVAKVELAMAFYLANATLIVLDAVQQVPFGSARKVLILAGALAGFGFGTKYNAGLYVPVLALPLLLGDDSTTEIDWRDRLKRIAIFLGSAAIVSSPWLLKDWFFYRNPVYPFLHGLFRDSPPADVLGLRGDARARDLTTAFASWDGIKDFLFGIWNVDAQTFDSYLGPALELGLPWVLLAKWKSPKQRGLLVAVIGIWLAWTLHTRLPRFVMPVVPLYCILVAMALCLIEMPSKARYALLGITSYAITISMSSIFMMLANSGTWKVAYGRMSRSEYLLHEHPAYKAPYYAAAEYINQNAPQEATVLVIGEERGFYLERKFITASWFNVNPMVDFAKASSNSEELLFRLRSSGISFLLINTGSEHYQRWLNELGPDNLAKYQDLLTHRAKLVYQVAKEFSPNDRCWVQVFGLADQSPSTEGRR